MNNIKKLLCVAVILCFAAAVRAQENSYGLREDIQEGVILHCFDWTLSDIKSEIPAIAKAGFSAVQTSPVHKGENVGAAWYILYQPYDYAIGNGIGNSNELTELCNTAHEYGVKIIVDVVANHTNGDLRYVASYWQDQSLYHDPFDVSNWYDRYQVTHGKIGMWDLKTEDSRVQEKIKKYIQDLKACGVDGIRWDAAKHIGLPSENDSFWSNVPDKTMYNYGEILDATGGNDNTLFPEYQQYISITDNQYGNGFASSFNNGQVNSSIGNFNQRGAETSKLVYWGESHDTYCNDGGSSKYISQNNIDRAYAVVAGNNGATALYFSRPSSTEKNNIKVGEKGSTHFTSKEVAEVNHLHNLCAGEPNYYVHEGNVAAQVRKSGAIIVLGSGSNSNVSFTNGDGKGNWMAAGTYTDKIGGGTFTVTSSTISGKVGSTGIAVISNGESTDPTDPTDPDKVYTPILTSPNETSCFLETTRSGTIRIWVWNDAHNFNVNGTWPGDEIQYMGLSANGNSIYKWTYSGTETSMPTNVIFTDNGNKIIDHDLQFVNHGYYIDGIYTKTISDVISSISSFENNGKKNANLWYTLSGQALRQPSTPGLYIHNGKKTVVK